MESKIALGKEISKIRLGTLRLTQKELADKLDITPVYLSYLEMGKKIPSVELLEKLYLLAKKREIPEDVRKIFADVKEQAKKDLTDSKITRLLDESSEESNNMYDMLETLVSKGRMDDAKKFIFKCLGSNMKPFERKLMESVYYQLEGNIIISIKLIKEAVEMVEH
jgi:transcriptional regulator with XRE-family HTH domain